jgi:pilus assembly protein CpaF
MTQGPFQETQIDALARQMQRVQETTVAQGDLRRELVQKVRRDTASQFSAARLIAADEAVRRWVEDYTREVVQSTRQEARAAGKPVLAGGDEEIVRHVLDAVLGLGELEPLRQMEGVEDVAINGPDEVYVFRRGCWERVRAAFGSEDELLELLNRAIAPTGRQVSPLEPIVDAVIPGGDRINVVVQPCARPSPCASIRVRAHSRISFLDLVQARQTGRQARPEWNIPDYTALAQDGAMLNALAATFLHMAVVAGLNVIVVGPTGVGKTTVLSALGGLVPAERRILAIEDTPELRLRQTADGQPGNCIYFLTRMRGIEGTPPVTQADLVRAGLRQRPDALTLGEARGGEILDLLKALATGHRNGLTSLHAEGVEEVPVRIKQMFQEADLRVDITNETVAQWIAHAFHLVVSLGLSDGKRYVREILEFSGAVEGEQPARQILFRTNPNTGQLEWTGMRMAREHLLAGHGLSFQAVIELANRGRGGASR